jgi:hypothetical protein
MTKKETKDTNSKQPVINDLPSTSKQDADVKGGACATGSHIKEGTITP